MLSRSESDDGQLRFDDVEDLNELSADVENVVYNVDQKNATREEEREAVAKCSLVRRSATIFFLII
jgi:hypothetical protein